MELGKFLKQRDMFFFLCVSAISTQLVIIADLLTMSCIVPIMNKNNDEEDKVENFVVNIAGAKVGIGKMFVALIRLLIIIMIIYILYYIFY